MTNSKTHLKPQSVGRNSPLAEFIRQAPQQIITEWVDFAKTLRPASESMTELQLKDHIKQLLEFVADDIESSQTAREQVIKSKGKAPDEPLLYSPAELHAALRLNDGFDLDQMVSEYRALRASVVKLWTASKIVLDNDDVKDLTRFNEAIDQAMTESISHYTKTMGDSRNIFLGILGHDLRTPLGAASMSAQLLGRLGTLNEKQTLLATQIVNCSARASQIVSDLLELTREGFGTEFSLNKTPVDLRIVGEELTEELKAFSSRNIILKITGDTKGEWDKSRIGQVFSNLIANAVQYSTTDSTITVSIKGSVEAVDIRVHNIGAPISPEKQRRIFDPLKRGLTNIAQSYSENLGLGLYITKRIVETHNGTIEMVSNEKEGTTFIVQLPRSLKQESLSR